MAFYYCDVCKLTYNNFVSCSICADKHNDMQICVDCCKYKKVYNCVYYDEKCEDKILFICDYCWLINKDPKDKIDLEVIETHMADIIKIKKEYPKFKKDKLTKQIQYFEDKIEDFQAEIEYFQAEIECLKSKLYFEDTELDIWIKELLRCTDQKES